ncbi:hypothetical protein Sjap_014768 [Stephania japonica]|uniref:Uncharacterized protein n=1 Tax=Stephania japonica TaxID=461633 RepID=A0AAP0IHX0_9MAGN
MDMVELDLVMQIASKNEKRKKPYTMDVAEFDLVMQVGGKRDGGCYFMYRGTNIMTTERSNSNSRSKMKEFKRRRLSFAESSDSLRRYKGVDQ